jgi:hypothetical protein
VHHGNLSSGIGQDADAPPFRRRFQYSHGRVIGMGLVMAEFRRPYNPLRYRTQAPHPLARCPTVAQFPFHKTPGLFHKTSGLSIRGEAP